MIPKSLKEPKWLKRQQRIMEWIEQGMTPQSNIMFTEGVIRDIAFLCEMAVNSKQKQ